MPLQNRVNPYGEICFSEHRGTFMGNRGLIHNKQQEITRDYRLKNWIICLLEFKGRHREVMQPGLYTELFFLDEATALAAGHRPCAECQYQRFKEFVTLWKKANQQPDIKLKELDDTIHSERTNKDRPLHSLGTLPDGVFIEHENQPFLIQDGQLWAWSFAGYAAPITLPAETMVKTITPYSVIRTIAAGFTVISPTGMSLLRSF